MSDEDIAKRFHEMYERLAPDFGYETRAETAVPWEDVPDANRGLMIAAAGYAVLPLLAERDAAREDARKLAEALERIRDLDHPRNGTWSNIVGLAERIARAALAEYTERRA